MWLRFLIYPLIFLLSPFQGYTWEVIEACEVKGNWIAYLQDDEGNPYILKQIIDPDPSEQFILLNDFVAHQIAEKCELPCNRVSLIPREILFAGKRYIDRAATLHAQVSGISLEEVLPWPEFTLHQRLRIPGTFAYKKWGHLPLRKSGLTPQIIQTMASHPHLQKIAALDTFVGNGERSNSNIFYNKHEDAYCGTDLASAFNRKLAPLAIYHIRAGTWSDSEIVALEHYLTQLVDLSQAFTPEKIEALLQEALETAGFMTYHDPAILDRLHHHISLFEENYAAVLTLIQK